MRRTDTLLLLADPDRLAVAGALAARASTTAELEQHTKRPHRVVLTALGELRSGGLVRVEGDVYVLDVDALRDLAKQATEAEIPMDPIIGYGMSADEREILERYFSGRALIEIPHNRAKFQIVLQRLALEFDVGRRYTEAEVNEILRPFNTDWSTLRRGLVDEGLLDRSRRGGETLYWRSGGRVTDSPPS